MTAQTEAQISTVKPFDEMDLSEEAIKHRDYIFNNAVGPSPKIKCKVNGVEVKALADSGSEITAITKSLYEQHFHSRVEDTTYWLHIGAANYEGVPYIGYTELDVEIDGQKVERAGILIQEDPKDPLKIQQKKEVPMTLGCNIMNRLVQDKLSDTLKAYMQVTHQHFQANSNKAEVILNPKKPHHQYGTAKTDRKLSILVPACTEMTITATTTQTEHPFEALVEGMDRQLPRGLVVFPHFQQVKEGLVQVHVGNLTDEDVYIPRNQKIAKVTIAEEVIPEYNIEIDEETGRKTVYLQEQYQQTPTSNTDIPDVDLGDISEFTQAQ